MNFHRIVSSPFCSLPTAIWKSLRAGFDCVHEYPFLNISLHQLKTISPARMMARYFTKDEKDSKESKDAKG